MRSPDEIKHVSRDQSLVGLCFAFLSIYLSKESFERARKKGAAPAQPSPRLSPVVTASATASPPRRSAALHSHLPQELLRRLLTRSIEVKRDACSS